MTDLFTSDRIQFHASQINPQTHQKMAESFQKHRIWGDLMTSQERSNYVYLCMVALGIINESQSAGSGVTPDFDVLVVPMINRLFPILQLQNLGSFLNAFHLRVQQNPGLDLALPAVYRPVIDSFVGEYIPINASMPIATQMAEIKPEVPLESTQEPEVGTALVGDVDDDSASVLGDIYEPESDDFDDDDKHWISEIDGPGLSLDDILGEDDDNEL